MTRQLFDICKSFFCKERYAKKHGFHNETFILETVLLHIHYFISLIHRSCVLVSCSFIAVFFLICRDHPIISPAKFSLNPPLLASGACLSIFSGNQTWKRKQCYRRRLSVHPVSAAAGKNPFLSMFQKYHQNPHHPHPLQDADAPSHPLFHGHSATADFKMYLQSMVWLKVSAKSTWVSSSPHISAWTAHLLCPHRRRSREEKNTHNQRFGERKDFTISLVSLFSSQKS